MSSLSLEDFAVSMSANIRLSMKEIPYCTRCFLVFFPIPGFGGCLPIPAAIIWLLLHSRFCFNDLYD